MESIELVIGTMTLVLSLAIKVFGEADQIRQNAKRRTTHGVSRPLYVLALATYVLWTVHGLLRGDWVLVGAQSLGIVTSTVILWQMWAYPDPSPE